MVGVVRGKKKATNCTGFRISQQQADSKKVSVNLYFNKQQPLSKNNLVFVSNIFRIANDSKFSAFLTAQIRTIMDEI